MDINTWQAWEHNSSPWVGYTSEEGAVYYYNKETGESSWENPIGVTPLQQPEHDTVEDYEYSSETNFQADDDVTETPAQNDPVKIENEDASETTDADRIGKIWGKFFENAALSSESSPVNNRKVIPPKVKRMVLHGACIDGDVDLLSVLYSQGAGDGEDIDVDELDAEGNTALHIAAKRGHRMCVQFLLESAASPQVKDADGNTALHLAAGQGNFAISKLLTTYGASIDAKNLSNESVVDIALTKAMQEAKPSAELMKTIELLRRIDAGEDVSTIDLETITGSSSDEAEDTPDVAVSNAESGDVSSHPKTPLQALLPRSSQRIAQRWLNQTRREREVGALELRRLTSVEILTEPIRGSFGALFQLLGPFLAISKIKITRMGTLALSGPWKCEMTASIVPQQTAMEMMMGQPWLQIWEMTTSMSTTKRSKCGFLKMKSTTTEKDRIHY